MSRLSPPAVLITIVRLQPGTLLSQISLLHSITTVPLLCQLFSTVHPMMAPTTQHYARTFSLHAGHCYIRKAISYRTMHQTPGSSRILPLPSLVYAPKPHPLHPNTQNLPRQTLHQPYGRHQTRIRSTTRYPHRNRPPVPLGASIRPRP